MGPVYLNRLYAYNCWAWEQVFASLRQLPIETYREERPFFWGSLHGLAVHGLTAEWIWLRRIQGESPTAMLDPADYVDVAAVWEAWQPVRSDWRNFLGTLSETELGRPVEYRNTRGHGFTLVLADVILHVMNHATEHRSQMTPVLYALGAATRELDYLRFCLRP